MRVAQAPSQHEVLSPAGLDRKAKEASRPQAASNGPEHLRQISDIDEHVGGDRKVDLFRSLPQKIDQLVADQVVVNIAPPRDLEHVRGDVDPGQGAGAHAQPRTEETRAATKIQNVEAGALYAAPNRIGQQVGRPILQRAGHMSIILIRIPVVEVDDEASWGAPR